MTENKDHIANVNKIVCPFCGAELENTPWENDWYNCPNIKCEHVGQSIHKSIWQALISGKQALSKILAIKESVEGCCAEIQQNCLPLLFSIDRDMKLKIDTEITAIDKYMSEIDEIASITKQEKE